MYVCAHKGITSRADRSVCKAVLRCQHNHLKQRGEYSHRIASRSVPWRAAFISSNAFELDPGHHPMAWQRLDLDTDLVPRAAWPPFPTSGRSGSHSSLADRYILSEIDRLSPLKYLLSQGTLRTLQQGEGEGLCSCFRFCMSGGLGRQSLCAWHIAGTAAGSADASTASSAQFFHPPCWKLC